MEQRVGLVQDVTEKEIWRALTSIDDLKAPGVDGFGSKFFKASWSTMKENVTTEV